MDNKPLDAKCDKLILTEEQMRCVTNAGKKSLIIEGKDKTGKSLVLMKMYAKLIDDCSAGESNKVAFFDSVSEFNLYINDIYEDLVSDGLAPKKNTIDEKERLQVAEKALQDHKAQFGRHRFHNMDAKLWLEEFDWIRGMNVNQEEIDDYLAMNRYERDKVFKMNLAEKVISFQIFSIYCGILNANNEIDALDQALFIYRHSNLIKESMKISHVLLDGGECLTRIQASILGDISNGTVVVSINKPLSEMSWGPKNIADDAEIKKLTVNQEYRKKEITEQKLPENSTKNITKEDNKQPQEKRKYTIDTSKARSGSLFRQLKDKDGTRTCLADGLSKAMEEKPKLDKNVYDKLIEEQNLASFIEAFKMLRKCMISRKMDDRIKILIERIEVLRDSIEKYNDVYQPDIFNFCDYYIPEILRLSETYLDYVEADIKWKILHENEMEIVSALDELLVAVNDKIDEIYRFASIELEAQARAVESIMNQNGYVKSDYKM